MTEFKPGDTAILDGREVTVIGVTSDGRYAWERDGGGACGFARDLLPSAPPEPETVVAWVNLFRYGKRTVAVGYESLNAAVIGSIGNNTIARARVVLTPGVFEDENTPSEFDRGWNAALEPAIEWLRNYKTDEFPPDWRKCAFSVSNHLRTMRRPS